MIKFVVSRPIGKIKRFKLTPGRDSRVKNAFLGGKDKRSKSRRRSIRILWIILIVFALVYGGFLLLKNTLFAPEYKIVNVHFNSGDVATYDDPYLYKAISTQLKQENFNVIRLNKNTILAGLQEYYPFLKDFVFTLGSSYTVNVAIVFNQPEMIIRNQDQKFGVFRGHTFPIYSGNTLGKDVHLIIDMPGYLSGHYAMTGLFFRQAANDLIQQFTLLYEGFPGLHHIEYLPGGERSVVYIEGRKIYINNLADIAQQIRNYQLLKKYYTEFETLSEIDLGSIELDKIIVKK